MQAHDQVFVLGQLMLHRATISHIFLVQVKWNIVTFHLCKMLKHNARNIWEDLQVFFIIFWQSGGSLLSIFISWEFEVNPTWTLFLLVRYQFLRKSSCFFGNCLDSASMYIVCYSDIESVTICTGSIPKATINGKTWFIAEYLYVTNWLQYCHFKSSWLVAKIHYIFVVAKQVSSLWSIYLNRKLVTFDNQALALRILPYV